nr:C1 family peptidase [Megasphaera elsdenii]
MTGCDMKALNLIQDAMEALCVKQLKKGQAIWFACDAGAFGARKEGIWDPDSVCYEALLMYSYDDRMRAVKLKSIWQN